MTESQIESVLRTLRHMRGVAANQFFAAWTNIDEQPPPEALEWSAVEVAHERAIEMFEMMIDMAVGE